MLRKQIAVSAIIAGALAFSAVAQAANLAVVGLFRDKAIVRIDGGAPRTLGVGQQVGAVTLLEADSRRAVFRVGDTRRVLEMGQSFASGPVAVPRTSVTLAADALGHYSVRGTLNGVATEFLVDTGATAVVLDSALARRAGIDYRAGERIPVTTANGVVAAWRVALAEVKIGDITVNQIDGVVIETPLPQALLGASFLNRLDMRREGARMTLMRR